jgi:hypothetical protein
MWQLRQTLEGLAQQGHLPPGFDASKGILGLFPGAEPKPINISLLRNYVFSSSGTASLSDIAGRFTVRADGAGNWAIGCAIDHPAAGGGDGRFGAGFVFGFSSNAEGHGFVQTGDYEFVDPSTVTLISTLEVWVAGSEPWIASHWPQAFAKSGFFYLSSATGVAKLPDIVNAATDHGFAGLASLQGSVVNIEYLNVPEFKQSGPSPPPNGFPGGVDWEIPADG